MRRSLLLAVVAAAALSACGNREAPDLFVLTRTGSVPDANLRLRVSDDGLVRCNGGPRKRIADPLLLDAREIARELNPDAPRRLPPGPRSVLHYRLRLEDGTVTFSDSSRRQTREMFLAQEFARGVAKSVCGLAR
jgi:hypothetical protein